MTGRDDVRLFGRHPEFARISNRPGLGVDAIASIAKALTDLDLVRSHADVPSALRHGKRLMPLGRYLRLKLRRAVGKGDVRTKEEVYRFFKETLHPLQQAEAQAAAMANQTVKERNQVLAERALNKPTRRKKL